MSMRPEKVKFEKGSIKTVGNPHDKKGAPMTEVKFSFNPTKLKVTSKANWDQPAQGGTAKPSKPNFKGSDPRVLAIEFTLDSWEDQGTKDLQDKIDTIQSWTKVTDKSQGDKKAHPPAVQLEWGRQKWFPAYVSSVDITITMFADDGSPQRATVSLSMKEVPKDTDKKPNPTSGSRVGHGSHLVVEGESLALIAHRAYDKAGYWRGIARANNISDPARVRPGTRIYLPPIEDVSVDSL